MVNCKCVVTGGVLAVLSSDEKHPCSQTHKVHHCHHSQTFHGFQSRCVCVCVRVCVCVCVCVHKLPATLMTMQLLCTLEHLWHNTYMFLVLKLIFKITDILAGTGKLLLFCRVLVTRTLTVVEDYSLMCYLGGNVVSSC